MCNVRIWFPPLKSSFYSEEERFPQPQMITEYGICYNRSTYVKYGNMGRVKYIISGKVCVCVCWAGT